MAIVLYDLCAGDAERRFSPNCWKARMALAHKGLDFETRPTPFTRIKEIGNGVSPTVPVIEDDGKFVRDSFDIALHLEESYPERPSLFRGKGGESHARFVESWALSSVNPVLIRLIVKDIHDQLDESDKAYFRESREKRLGGPDARIGSVPFARRSRRSAICSADRTSSVAPRHCLPTTSPSVRCNGRG